MAIKKSELYSSLWASCDELRGSMDASQYKDYVLVFLFMKYVSDKGGELVDIPEGCSFKDLIKLKGKPDIGDQINKKITELAKANDLYGIITVADFDDDEKLGKGKDKVDRLSNLISIFENEALDFSGNTSEGDDILGDAYEYLMRNFATESGKSKGQFYTPAEVSRIMAKVIGINKRKHPSDTLYDPTCGSGSLLLKAADEAPDGKISIYGQEMDNATRALAVMNMWLHNNPSSDIEQGNTLSTPHFTDDKTGGLRTFDFAVANPPFSTKSWMNGFDASNDIFKRFDGYDSLPPKKNGDYAFLLHLIKSIKSKGKGTIVLPLGVLFRGNAEADIRKRIINNKYIKGIIGLPPNLFYGTGIAACLVILDKEEAEHRTGIFMIDASKGFIKDGNKNRLRERDIHKIVDVFNNRIPIDKYSRMIPLSEIADPKNDYNLNIPRYIDSQEPEDLQDIEAHLRGDIPNRDIDELENYWKVYPTLKSTLFSDSKRKNYSALNIPNDEIKNTIFNHPEFLTFSKQMDKVFKKWYNETATYLKELRKGIHPKKEISVISESLLKYYAEKQLTDKYAMYQHLMDYWAETMQDDMYELAADGWKAGNEVKRIVKKTKKGDKEIIKEVAGIEGLEGRLIPPSLIIEEYFYREQHEIDEMNARLDAVTSEEQELLDEHSVDEAALQGVSTRKDALETLKEYAILACETYLTEMYKEYHLLNEKYLLNKNHILRILNHPLMEPLKNNKGKIANKAITLKLKENISESEKANLLEFLERTKIITDCQKKINAFLEQASEELVIIQKNNKNADYLFEFSIIMRFIELLDDETKLKADIKKALKALEKKIINKYPAISIDEIKHIVIDKKWMNSIEQRIKTEMDNISHRLTQRIKDLAERYETPLPKLTNDVNDLTAKVENHLKKMNFVW